MAGLDEERRSALKEAFLRGSEKSDSTEMREALTRSGEKIRKLEAQGVPSSLESLWEEIKLLYGMIADSVRGKYKLPIRSIGAITFTLLYFVNPFDAMPDIVPLIGYVDDAFVIGLCMKFIESDLKRYSKWRSGKDAEELSETSDPLSLVD